ncbi:deaminase domain-containing protein [Pseudomonas atagonensis]|uniref:deaminase domain-containing protein n=1 Tax=Pseudomonas atagonensis TaxID=2609964 RepID=UPI00140B062B|nr:deaminase domain-containing protein [Pseudomonas atagonensis]
MTSTPSVTPGSEESLAIQALGLDDGPDIDALFAPPSARDRKRFKASLSKKPTLDQTMTLDQYKAERINQRIFDTVKSFMNANPMLIYRLAGDVLHSPSAEDIRATPWVFVRRILDSAPSQDLVDQLLKKLRWYGARPGEKTSASLRYQLLCKAICLYLQKPLPDEPQDLAGFDWQDSAHWGKSYQSLRMEFEQHLKTSKRVIYSKEAIVLAQIFQTRLSGDFSVRDIPADLRYKSSIVWVNFMHGVLLVDAFDLKRSMAFQDLVNLPLQLSDGASPDQLERITEARLGPALTWAVCTGLIESKSASSYGVDDIKQAIEALETQSTNLNSAVMTVEDTIPERLKMAKKFKDAAFGADALETDGYKFLPTNNSHLAGGKDMHSLALAGYSFLDLYADGRFDEGERWIVTQADGITPTKRRFRIDSQRKSHLESETPDGTYRDIFGDIIPNERTFPDVNALFTSGFDRYQTNTSKAYQTLIASLLVSLPVTERKALARGDIEVLRLRRKLRHKAGDIKARKGFVLKATQDDNTITYHEVIPSAGFIRPRNALRLTYIDGVRTELPLHAEVAGESYAPERDISATLLLDEKAFFEGTLPAEKSWCTGYLDSVLQIPAATFDSATAIGSEWTVLTTRLNELAEYIAAKFPYVDEKELRAEARGMTIFDEYRARNEKRQELAYSIVKGFVPFWGSIDDLLSDKTSNQVIGGIGLLADLASFLFPIGKFISGSVRLIKASSGTARIAVKASLPSFSTLSRKLLTSSLSNINPLSGIPTLLKGIAKGALGVARSGVNGLKSLHGKVGAYRLAHNLPQAIDPGQWKQLNSSDRLVTVNGIGDVLVRHTSATDPKRLHLVDPVTSLPFGPRLRSNRHLIQGRSTYKALPPTESHALAEVPEHARVREWLEVDGRTTLLIDEVPYRLDGDQLRRADLINDQSKYKAMPCRIRRDGGDLCQTKYVLRDPAPTPAHGSFDESKGWAPWFGDSLYTPAVAGRPMSLAALKSKNQFTGTVEFQKGIYGRIKVEIPVGNKNQLDTFEAGATIVPAMDGSRHYVFTRVDAGDFYVAELASGQGLSAPLTLRKADLSTELNKELMIVYTGSLNANNTVRIHGIETVERAMKTMDEIAIPIGGHAVPPDTLKLLKVDTSPGEAVLFDHSTRMIVSQLPAGTGSWSRSRQASPAFRQRAADIFDTLFEGKAIQVGSGTDTEINLILHSDLKLNKVMQNFQKLLPANLRTRNARNIAYADIVTASGKREVYVSVSGAHGLTGEFPLFKPPFAKDKVIVGDTTYFNIDAGESFTRTSLNVSEDGKVLAIPHTIKDIDTYTPALTTRPTSLDSEAKLISAIRGKYPDNATIRSIDVVTTMHPCNSCSVVIKEFAHDGGPDSLKVLWQ